MSKSGRWTRHVDRHHLQVPQAAVSSAIVWKPGYTVGSLALSPKRLPPLVLCTPMKLADPTGDVAGLGYPPESPPSHSRIRTGINDLSLNVEALPMVQSTVSA